MGFLQRGRGGQAVGRAMGSACWASSGQKRGTGTHMDRMERQNKISFFLARWVGWAEAAHL